MQPDPLSNIDAGILGMYAAIKIFRFNGIDPHKMMELIVNETNQKLLSPAQTNVLKRLMAGWTLDRYGKDGMQGYMVRGQHERAIISAKMMNFLFSERLICTSISGIMDFEITTHGKAAIK